MRWSSSATARLPPPPRCVGELVRPRPLDPLPDAEEPRGAPESTLPASEQMLVARTRGGGARVGEGESEEADEEDEDDVVEVKAANGEGSEDGGAESEDAVMSWMVTFRWRWRAMTRRSRIPARSTVRAMSRTMSSRLANSASGASISGKKDPVRCAVGKDALDDDGNVEDEVGVGDGDGDDEGDGEEVGDENGGVERDDAPEGAEPPLPTTRCSRGGGWGEDGDAAPGGAP